jgi:hypothetical protein
MRLTAISSDLKPLLGKIDIESVQKSILTDLKRQPMSFCIIHDFLATYWVTNKGLNSEKDPFVKSVCSNCLEIITAWYAFTA